MGDENGKAALLSDKSQGVHMLVSFIEDSLATVTDLVKRATAQPEKESVLHEVTMIKEYISQLGKLVAEADLSSP